jgi:TolA-binding protein
MNDEELDRNWQPSGRRPQSTMARSFSQELMDIFRIENSLTDLDKQIDERKQKVTQESDELAALERRIREMDERLRGNAPRAPAQASTTQTSRAETSAPAPPAKDNARSRPGTAKPTQGAPSSGNMPPTPGASEDGHGE